MKSRLVRHLLLALSLVGLVALGCEGDPPKRSALDSGGEGGAAAGDGPAPNKGGAGKNTEPTAGQGPVVEGGAGGAPPDMPPDMPPDGGTPSTAGNGNTAGAPAVVACEGEVTFPDAWFEQNIRDALDQVAGPIMGEDLAALTSFTLSSNDSGIDITGIECLVGVQTLLFNDNVTPDSFALLAQLPNLRELQLQGDYLSDISELGGLTQLTSLDLTDNFIGDFSPLASLINLETLNISRNGDFSNIPIDLTPLHSLTALKSLNLDFDDIDDLTALQLLTQLEVLSLHYVNVTDTSVLADLTNLTSLNLQSAGLTDISDLEGLTKLTSLDLGFNAISDFTPLESLTNLTSLNLANTGLTSLTSIAPLTALTTLDVSYDLIPDVTVLGALPALQWLDISYNSAVTSLTPLVNSSYLGAGDEITAYAVSCSFAADFTALAAKNITMNHSCN